MQRLSLLRSHGLCANTQLHSDQYTYFTYNDKKVAGLINLLKTLCPVPIHRTKTCSRCSARKRFKGCRVKSDRAHGILIDGQLDRIAQGKGIRDPDPCTIALLAYFKSRGWKILTTQVPIYCTCVKRATAIDVLCTDAATSTKLYLIEVKSTRITTNHECYEIICGHSQHNLPLSYYILHQLQLATMYTTIVHDCNIALDGAYVLRTYPGGVYVYPLCEQLVDFLHTFS